jgi:tetratricopeptide (TPR) repeat protein
MEVIMRRKLFCLSFTLFAFCLLPFTFAAPTELQLPGPEVGLVLLKANQAYQDRKWDEALRLFNEALTKSRALKDKAGEAAALFFLGNVYRDIEQPQKALGFYQQALRLHQQIGDKQGEATTLTNIGLLYHDIGQPQQALKFYEQALSLNKEVGDKAGKAVALNNMGSVYRQIGQPQKALEFFRQAFIADSRPIIADSRDIFLRGY